MKIVHVGQFHLLKPKGAYVHSVAPKLSNGLIRNGHRVFDFSDRDMARATSIFANRKMGVGSANRLLRSLCGEIGPDLLILGHADVIGPETIAVIRGDHPKLRVLQWSVDPLFEPDNLARVAKKLDVVDATLISTSGDALRPLIRPGKLVGFMPNPVDFSIESGTSFATPNLPYDLFCAAGPDNLRNIGGEMLTVNDLIDRIKLAIPTIRCRLGMLKGQPHLKGIAYQQALAQSAIGINVSRRNDVPLYSSDRLAHLVGNGLAVLVDRATGYDRLFTDEQFAFFSSVGEMIERLRALVANPARRAALAAAGRARYHELFNERRVAQYVVEAAFGEVKCEDYEWPTVL